LQFGGVCKNCPGPIKCKDKPTAVEPLEMECVGCGGNGCLECDDSGILKIARCPLELISGDVWEIITLAELFEKGLPPVAGGVLEQAKTFVETAKFIFREKAYWKQKMGILS